MSVRRLMSVGVGVVLCVLAGGLMFAGASASAEDIYYPGVSFGEPGPGPGQFDEPVGVAVNDAANALLEPTAGDVYVVDEGNDRVEYFTAAGVFAGQFNGSAAPTGRFSAPEQIAVDNTGDSLDPSAGDVYVTDTGHDAIDKFNPTGEYRGQLTGVSCKERKGKEGVGAPVCKTEEEFLPFKNLRGIAVDELGDLWVYGGLEEEGAQVLEFSDTGSFIREFSSKAFEYSNHGLAVDADENIYVSSGIGQEISKLTATGGRFDEGVTEGVTFDEGVNAIAFIPAKSRQLADGLLVDVGNEIQRYGPFGEPYSKPQEVFPGEDVPSGYEGLSKSYGLAVNMSATVYASERETDRVESFDYVPVPAVTTQAPSGVTETGLVLHGSVNPEGEMVKECYFEYGAEAGIYTSTAPCEQAPGGGAEAVAVSASVSGLSPADVRSFRLVAVSVSGVAGRGGGLTIARPVASDERASGVGSVAATLNAQLDSGGLATCYWMEYGTSPSYGQRTPEECVGAGGQGVGVGVEVAGLEADTQYHFRVWASNALGATPGGDSVFKTFPVGASALPDGRVYELVSPVGAGHDTEVYAPEALEEALDTINRHGISSSRPFQAAPDGEAVAYLGDPPAKGGNGDIGTTLGNEYIAKRLPGGGWTQVDVDPSGYHNHYVAFSSDLSAGLLSSPERLATEAPLGYTNLYRRSVGWRSIVGGSSESVVGAFEPAITAMPSCESAGEFGSILSGRFYKEPQFGGSNAGTGTVLAFSHLLFEANAPLPSIPSTTEPVSCNTEAGDLDDDLYDAVDGRLYLVNVSPKGTVEPAATFGRQGPSESGVLSPETSGAISADGSRIYWSTVEPIPLNHNQNGKGEAYEERPTALFVRENDTQPQSQVEDGECTEPAKACTVQVDLAEPGAGESGGGQFWTASSNGSEVFFTDEHALTRDSSAQAGTPDLYEYDLSAPEGERLSDLSVPVDAGAHGDVQGVLGVSQDGSYVYFVADGVLTQGANVEGGQPVQGQPNLYVRHGGQTKFIATLSEEDDDFNSSTAGEDGDWQADPGHRTAEVTPDGRSVVFMSRSRLTGYDNGVETEHAGAKIETSLTEVFVYDAETEHVSCASCNPSGEPAVGDIAPEFAENLKHVWGSFVPVSNSLADYQPRVISDNGSRVFFDSVEPLVPQDTNGFLDVYEWERDGSGGCSDVEGCVHLLSGGQSTDNSYLVDASTDGDDVFFVTRGDLVRADRGDYDELYDARVGGVEPVAEARCSGAGCQGVPPAPPIFVTPSSVTFDGVGDFPVSAPPSPTVAPKAKSKKPVGCKKGFVKRKGKCVKKKRAGRAKSSRGGKR